MFKFFCILILYVALLNSRWSFTSLGFHPLLLGRFISILLLSCCGSSHGRVLICLISCVRCGRSICGTLSCRFCSLNRTSTMISLLSSIYSFLFFLPTIDSTSCFPFQFLEPRSNFLSFPFQKWLRSVRSISFLAFFFFLLFHFIILLLLKINFRLLSISKLALLSFYLS